MGPPPDERASASGEGLSSLRARASITRPLCSAIKRRNTPSLVSARVSELGACRHSTVLMPVLQSDLCAHEQHQK